MSIARARAFRRRMPPAEARLWIALRAEPLRGFHFRRQVPLGRYYADFASHQAKLVIEVDGSTHFDDGAVERDANRTAFLHSQGYRVLRFTTPDVLNRIEAVLATILGALEPHPPASPVPPPHEGEGEPTTTH